MPIIHPTEKDLKNRAIIIATYLILTLGAVTQIFPFLWMLSSSLKDNVEIYKLPPKLIPPKPTMVELQFIVPEDVEQKQLEADAVLASFYLLKKKPEVKEVRTKFFSSGKLVYEMSAPRFQSEKLWDKATVSKATERQDWISAAGEICRELGGHYYPEGKKTSVPPLPQGRDKLRMQAAEIITEANLYSTPRSIIVGRSFSSIFDSYRKAWTALGELPISRFFGNSLIIAICSVAWQLFVCSLSAYAISRMVSPMWSRVLLLFFIGTMMIPGMVLTIPNYLILKDFPFKSLFGIPFPHVNLLNTFWALILPAGASGFAVYLFKGFFDQLPMELLDAARIDGATELDVFTRIAVPLSKPVFAVLGIMSFMGSWNDFMWPFIVIQEKKKWPLMVGLYQLQNSVGEPNVVMASLVLGALPVILMFIFFQRYILEGIVMTGLKG